MINVLGKRHVRHLHLLIILLSKLVHADIGMQDKNKVIVVAAKMHCAKDKSRLITWIISMLARVLKSSPLSSTIETSKMLMLH